MMNKFKCIVLLLGIIIPTAIGLANSGATKEKDGGCPVVINKSKNTEFDRSSSISASIDVSYASGNEVETTSIYTPSGVIIYIPYSGSYIVTFTLPNGDEYYGVFEVTD